MDKRWNKNAVFQPLGDCHYSLHVCSFVVVYIGIDIPPDISVYEYTDVFKPKWEHNVSCFYSVHHFTFSMSDFSI